MKYDFRHAVGRLRSKSQHAVAIVSRRLDVMRARRSYAGPKRDVYVTPERPSVHSLLYLVAPQIGIRFQTVEKPGQSLVLYWQDATYRRIINEPSQSIRVLNQYCDDISKSNVGRAFTQAFSVTYLLDPEYFHGIALEKSELNASHSGVPVVCPTSRREGYCYQRLVDNVAAPGMTEDLRVAVVGRQVPLAYRKLKPIEQRFHPRNTVASLVSVTSILTEEEIEAILTMAQVLGIDYGEFDCLRDRSNGKLYVVDANPTPWGPANHLSKHDSECAVSAVAEAFAAEFLS